MAVAAPAGGNRLLRSRAREQAVSSKIPFGLLKEEVFLQTRKPAGPRGFGPRVCFRKLVKFRRDVGSRVPHGMTGPIADEHGSVW